MVAPKASRYMRVMNCSLDQELLQQSFRLFASPKPGAKLSGEGKNKKEYAIEQLRMTVADLQKVMHNLGEPLSEEQVVDMVSGEWRPRALRDASRSSTAARVTKKDARAQICEVDITGKKDCDWEEFKVMMEQ